MCAHYDVLLQQDQNLFCQQKYSKSLSFGHSVSKDRYKILFLAKYGFFDFSYNRVAINQVIQSISCPLILIIMHAFANVAESEIMPCSL